VESLREGEGTMFETKIQSGGVEGTMVTEGEAGVGSVTHLVLVQLKDDCPCEIPCDA
jgi:hypothetical protein